MNSKLFFLVLVFFGDLSAAISDTVLFTSSPSSVIFESISFEFSNELPAVESHSFLYSKEIRKASISSFMDYEGEYVNIEGFGILYRYPSSQWSYHVDWGQIYIQESDSSFWFYSNPSGWHWSSLADPATYPFIYSETKEWWLYFLNYRDRNWIYDFHNTQWLPLYDYLSFE